MKILQLGKFYPIRGGVEKVMYSLMEGVSARGVRCDMLCADNLGDSDSIFNSPGPAVREIVLNPNATLYVCRTIRKAAATTLSPEMIRQLRKMAGNYDIIHVHHPDPMACLALMLSGFKGKVVLHWHSDIIRQKTLLKLYMPLQNWLIRRADLILGTTPVYVAQSPHLMRAHDKIDHLAIGIPPVADDPVGAQAKRALFPGRKIVFSLGRLVGYKGFSYLVEAAKSLPDDYVVVIGGTGPLRDELEAQIAESKLQDKVKLLGYVPDEDIPAWYGACDLYCLSSIHKTEAFAIVQIEAMSCGKPVVSTRIRESGVAWVNSGGEAGVVVEPFDGDALADAIVKICANPEIHARYCEGARRRYEEKFTDGRMIDGVLEYYSKL